MTALHSWRAEAQTLLAATRGLHLDAAVGATALAARRPLMVCGHGGSAADAEHILGKLVGRFLRERPAYKAIALTGPAALLTAWTNDYHDDSACARQVEAHDEGGGRMAPLCDHLLAVLSRVNDAVQQVHLCLDHCPCAGIEARLADASR